MTITLTNAEGSIDEIKQTVVNKIITDYGESLKLVTAIQACGILNISKSVFQALKLDEVDVCSNGSVIRYRLCDIEELLRERTIKGTKKKPLPL